MNESNPSEQAETSAAPQRSLQIPKALIAPLTRSELVAALDSEIENIEDENKRPGWSSWALQGGIATFIWLALADFSPKSNLQTIGIVFLFGSFFGDFLLLVCQYFNRLSHPERKRLRYRFSSDNPDTAPALIIFALVRYSSLLLIYQLLSPVFYVPTLTLYCVATIALYAFLLICRLMKLLLQERLLGKSEHSVLWLIMVWSGFLSYRLFEKLPFSNADYKVVDFRVGFLLVGVVYLFWLLATGEKERPIVSTLKQIRRDLAFGHISIEQAGRDADLALLGLTTTAAIEHKLTEISDKFQNVVLCYEKLIADCQTADLSLKHLEANENQQDTQWKEDASKVAMLIDSCENKRITTQQLLNAVFFKAKNFNRSIQMLNTADSVPKPELAPKWQDMKMKMEKMLELSKVAAPLLEDIKARYIRLSV